MNIDGNNSVDGRKYLGSVHDLKKNQDVEKKGEANKTESEKDKVSLSGKAKEISDLKGLIGEIPDIRRDKIDSVKKALDMGTYKFDFLKVAENILKEEI